MNTYHEIRKACESNKRNPGERKLANNTWATVADNGDVEIRLHGHRVVVLRSDGTAMFSMCGWGTMTTAQRVNTYVAPNRHGLSRRNWEWSYNGSPVEADEHYNVDADGNLLGAALNERDIFDSRHLASSTYY